MLAQPIWALLLSGLVHSKLARLYLEMVVYFWQKFIHNYLFQFQANFFELQANLNAYHTIKQIKFIFITKIS